MSDQGSRCTAYFQSLQDRICTQLEALDTGGQFAEDSWQRPGGGGGRSRTILGEVIEKGGVGFSHVFGKLSEGAARSLGTAASDFEATGVSIVLHPRNPWLPIIHMNVRYFELAGGSWWFGGGIDLTPHYILPAQARDFHARMQSVCAAHPACADYGLLKAQADDYFYIPHRQETRGVGGIFYDRLHEPGFDATFAFTQAVGESFVPAYAAQVTALAEMSFGESEKSWQRLRRGRYVEFNLVWDRGTKFGLETNGRTESILMSLPPQADWVYTHQVTRGSHEAYTLQHLRKGIDWLDNSLMLPQNLSQSK